MPIRKFVTIYFLFLLIPANAEAAFATTIELDQSPNAVSFAERFYRTELYFGTAKPDGTVVTDEEWSGFPEAVIMPKFPSGFTVLEGYGQFSDSAGETVKEKSRCVILLDEKKEKAANGRKIERIREACKEQFQQESFLRNGFPANGSGFVLKKTKCPIR